jgi:hypothetical protein
MRLLMRLGASFQASFNATWASTVDGDALSLMIDNGAFLRPFGTNVGLHSRAMICLFLSLLLGSGL